MATTIASLSYRSLLEQVKSESEYFFQQILKRNAILIRKPRLIDYVSFVFYDGVGINYALPVHDSLVAKMVSGQSDFQNVPNTNADVIQNSMLIHRQKEILPVLVAKGWNLEQTNFKMHDIDKLSHDIVGGSTTSGTDSFIGYDMWFSLGYYGQRWYHGTAALTGPVEWYIKKMFGAKVVNQVDADWYTNAMALELEVDPKDVNAFMYVAGKRMGKC